MKPEKKEPKQRISPGVWIGLLILVGGNLQWIYGELILALGKVDEVPLHLHPGIGNGIATFIGVLVIVVGIVLNTFGKHS